MSDQDHINMLAKSRQLIGELSPLIIDFDGEVLAGTRRKKAGWMRKYQVDTMELAKKWEVPVVVAKEMIRTSSNVQRTVPKKETQTSLLRMAEAFEKAGVPLEKIAGKVAEKVPFTDRYVRELLPDKYKMVQMAREPEIAELVPQKPEVKVIEAPETWEYREARMHPSVSRMDEAVLLALQREGWDVEFQREYCVQSTITDLKINATPDGRKVNAAVYLDGPVHEKHEERDQQRRELLSKRYGLRVVSIPYERYSDQAREEVVQRIHEAFSVNGG